MSGESEKITELISCRSKASQKRVLVIGQILEDLLYRTGTEESREEAMLAFLYVAANIPTD